MPDFNESHFPPLPTKKNPCTDQKDANRIAHKNTRSTAEALATINDLPDELVLNILDYLPGINLEDFQLAALVSLSSTNRCFHRLVAEKLYCTFDSHFCEPYLFLRTVTSNTHLAKFVQLADLTYGTWAHRERKRHTASAQDKKIIKEGLKSLGVPDWKTWATDCNADHAEVEALYIAILAQTPNISTIKISNGRMENIFRSRRTPKYIDLFRRANLGTSLGSMHRFRSLRSLTVLADVLTVTQLAPVFRTPSLRKLQLEELVEHDEGGERAEQFLQHIIPSRCNNLEELHLTRSFVQNDVLGVMVASARKLKVFKYEVMLDKVDYELEDQDVDCTKIDTALRCQKQSLQTLSFASDADSERPFRDPFTLGEGLQDFDALTHLSCPLGSIVDRRHVSSESLADRLPQSLIALNVIIRYYSDDLDKAAMPVLEHLAETYAYQPPPHLKELRITVESPYGWCTYDWARIIKPLSQTGIEVVIEEEEEDRWEDDDNYDRLSEGTTSTESSDEVSLYSHSEEEGT